MDNSENQIFGAYNGISIRCKQYKTRFLISATDLKKASEGSSKYRFDRWRNRKDIQVYLAKVAKKLNVEPIKNKANLITEVSGELEVFSGGVREFQGTYVSKELAKQYAKWVSEDCYQWLDEFLTGQKSGEVIEAQRVTVQLGNIKIDVYQIPNGEYRLSQTQVEQIPCSKRNSFSDFLTSKSPEALPYKGFRFQKLITNDGNNVRLKAVPILLAVAFWTKESIKGNEIAARLLGACAVESIEHRADRAFGKEVTEEEYNNRFKNNYQSIIASCPKSFITKPKIGLNISIYQGDGRKLKTLYPQGVIPGFTKKERIIERMIYLSSHAKDEAWKLKARQELTQVGNTRKSKYPDIMSGVISINNVKSIFIFQVYDEIVKPQDIESCVARRYTQIARKLFKVNYSFLFLVSPLGASPSASTIIQEEIEIAENQSYNFMGVMTIKELAKFYYHQALSDKKNPKNIGGIKKDFKPFMDYKIYSPIDEAVQLSLPLVSTS